MDMDKAIKNNLAYYKRVHEEIKARRTRASLIYLQKIGWKNNVLVTTKTNTTGYAVFWQIRRRVI